MAKPVKHNRWLVWMRMVRGTTVPRSCGCSWCKAWKRGMRWHRWCSGPCRHDEYRRKMPKVGL